VLVLWHTLGSFYHATIFPDLFELGEAIYSVYTGNEDYLPSEHIWITFVRILLTFIIAMPLGVLLGIAMGRHWWFEAYFSPYVLFSLAFPSIVWAFLAVIWFGLTEYLLPVFVGVLITMPFVIINIWQGTKNIDKDLLEMARSYESSPLLVWRYILIPHLTPYIYSMMRIVLSVSWKVMLVAEIFGTQSGLGFVINQYFLLRENDMIIAWTLPAMLAIFLLERGLKRQEESKFQWRPEADADTEANMRGA
jgi:NitT/TauT family transport system permease protein